MVDADLCISLGYKFPKFCWFALHGLYLHYKLLFRYPALPLMQWRLVGGCST